MTFRTAFACALLALSASAAAAAGTVTLAWDANPPAEQVTHYQVYEGPEVLWQGPQTTATFPLSPGPHTYYVKACNEVGCSLPSESVSTTGLATSPRGLKLTITVELR